jgi:GT2 family glycosyltransferase
VREQEPLVTIVISSHRPDFIADPLRLLQQQQGAIPFDTVVVADYPVDAFRTAFPQVQWQYRNDRSISAKRNEGVRNARGRIIGFLDDDCRPSDCWIAAATAWLEAHPEAAGVEGLTTIETVPGVGDGLLREFKRLERQGYRTNNIFYRKDAFLSVGGFDERFTVQREDIDLAFMLLEKGFTIGYSETVRVEHRYRHWERWDLLKNCWNRRFDPLLYRKHRHRYRVFVGSPFPKGLLLLLIAHASGVAGLAVRSMGLTVGVAVFDFLLLGFLAARRTGAGCGSARRFMTEAVAVAAAPFVLLAALVYGSVKFRKLLLA